MKFLELQKALPVNIFTLLDVAKLFPNEKPLTLRIQLSRFAKRGLIRSIKRGLYAFDPQKIDEFLLANFLYSPSYVSLESTLNYYGLIPDVPQAITSVSLTTSKKICSELGSFYYAKIRKELFFGFIKIPASTPNFFINLARPEKALLDYFYLRKIKSVKDLRLDLKDLDRRRYQKYAQNFPFWVQKIL